MNLQEKYNEYKQRQEAKKFFNQNNDYHLSISDYIKIYLNIFTNNYYLSRPPPNLYKYIQQGYIS